MSYKYGTLVRSFNKHLIAFSKAMYSVPMKRFFSSLTQYIVCIYLLPGSYFFVDGQNLQSGIHFQSGTFANALATARSSHKLLFVEVYLNNCSHCAALAPILAEKQVGDFFNTHFISWKVEANSAEATALQKQKKISFPEYPLCLFLDGEGNLVHVAVPDEKKTKPAFVEEVLSVGRTALNPAQRAAGYAARFKAGERNLAFLVNYGKYCITRADNQQLHEVSEVLGKTLKPDQLKRPVGLYCLQQLIDNIDNPAAAYFFSHLNEFTTAHSSGVVKITGERIIFRTLYGPKGDQYSSQKLIQIRNALIASGTPAQQAYTGTFLKELSAYLRERNSQAAVQRVDEYRRATPKTGLAEYAYLMRLFNEKALDTAYLSAMPVWASAGLRAVSPEQVNTQLVADLYYELATAYKKMGQKAEALKTAQQGLSIAQKSSISIQKYENQVTALK